MIYYSEDKINDWNYADDNIIKVYRHNAICYYKMVAGEQEPCYAVVDDITKYSDTEFIDVFDKATSKWYKLNNLNDFEEYGVYGEGRNITYYEGKLTIDTNKEYIYSGSGWTYVGDVSGSTTSLPDVAFSLNYNAKDYDATNHLFPKTSGQSVNVDATLQGTYGLTAHTDDGYVSYSGASGQSGALIGGYQNYINRGNTSGNCELTIVSKQKRTGNNSNAHSLLANRDATNYNWMWRIKNNLATLHGNSETGNIAISMSEPNIISVRVGYDGGAKVYYNNWTQNTSTSKQTFTYGNLNTNGFAMFNGYYTHPSNSSKETFEGDFYWVYMTPDELTDEQIQEVIDFNEGEGTTVYPLYYTVKQDPPQNLVFTDMAEAEAYRCPYVGLKATIGGEKYIFNANYEWEKYGLPSGYTEVEYVQSTGRSSVNLGVHINSGMNDTYTIVFDNEMTYESGFGELQTFLACQNEQNYHGWSYRFNSSGTFDFSRSSMDAVDVVRTNISANTYHNVMTCVGVDYYLQNNNPIALFSGLDPNLEPFRFVKGKLYNMQITLNDVMIADFVPAKRDNDDVYGVYDKISNVFYTTTTEVPLTGGNAVG